MAGEHLSRTNARLPGEPGEREEETPVRLRLYPSGLAARAAAQAVEALLPVKGPILEAPRGIHEPPDVVTAQADAPRSACKGEITPIFPRWPASGGAATTPTAEVKPPKGLCKD
jgi:hypothetical protein